MAYIDSPHSKSGIHSAGRKALAQSASRPDPEVPVRGRHLRHPRAYLGFLIFTSFVMVLAVTFVSLRG